MDQKDDKLRGGCKTEENENWTLEEEEEENECEYKGSSQEARKICWPTVHQLPSGLGQLLDSRPSRDLQRHGAIHFTVLPPIFSREEAMNQNSTRQILRSSR